MPGLTREEVPVRAQGRPRSCPRGDNDLLFRLVGNITGREESGHRRRLVPVHGDLARPVEGNEALHERPPPRPPYAAFFPFGTLRQPISFLIIYGEMLRAQ